MEITNEIKAKIFALYIGCYAYVKHQELENFYFNDKIIGISYKKSFDKWGIKTSKSIYDYPISDCQLILKPLSAITDEDAIEVLFIGEQDESREIIKVKRYDKGISIEYRFINKKPELNNSNGYCYSEVGMVFSAFNLGILEIDYLRSKGYMLPYMGIDLFDADIAITHN